MGAPPGASLKGIREHAEVTANWTSQRLPGWARGGKTTRIVLVWSAQRQIRWGSPSTSPLSASIMAPN
jgi:hypothetical protein